MPMPMPLSSKHSRDLWRNVLQEEIELAKKEGELCTSFFCSHTRALLLHALDVLDAEQEHSEQIYAALRAEIVEQATKIDDLQKSIA